MKGKGKKYLKELTSGASSNPTNSRKRAARSGGTAPQGKKVKK